MNCIDKYDQSHSLTSYRSYGNTMILAIMENSAQWCVQKTTLSLVFAHQ